MFRLKTSRKNKNKGWNFFLKIDIRSTKCKKCDVILKENVLQ